MPRNKQPRGRLARGRNNDVHLRMSNRMCKYVLYPKPLIEVEIPNPMYRNIASISRVIKAIFYSTREK